MIAMFRKNRHKQHHSDLPLSIPIKSWYPPSVIGPAMSPSHILSPSELQNGKKSHQKENSDSNKNRNSKLSSPASIPYSPRPATPLSPSLPFQQSKPLPNGVSDTLLALKTMSTDNLRRLLSGKEEYMQHLQTVEDIKELNDIKRELIKGNLDLARSNLNKNVIVTELLDQCNVIKTIKLPDALHKFTEARRMESIITEQLSAVALRRQLQGAINSIDKDSEVVQTKFLTGSIDLTDFIHKYRTQRTLYHRRSLTELASSNSG